MAEVGSARFGDGIVVYVDNAVEIVRDGFCDGVELFKVVLAVRDEGGESEGGEVTYGSLLGRRVLDDLRAEVGRFDSTDILLVRFCCEIIISVNPERSMKQDLPFAASLYTINGPPVSICASKIAYHSF
jgi:hypothetical protein